jgi:hypothetical protein
MGLPRPPGSPIEHPSLLSHRPASTHEEIQQQLQAFAHVVSSAGGVLVILRSMLSSVLRFGRVKISFRKESET